MERIMCSNAGRIASGIFGLAILGGVGLLSPGVAIAAADPAVKCQSTQAAAAGKYAACLTSVSATAIKKAESGDSAKLFKCRASFVSAMRKAEGKAAGACPSSGDSATLERAIDGSINGVVVSLGGMPGAGGVSAKCQSGKAKESGKYAACKFKTLSKAIKDNVAPDFGKCEDTLTKKFNSLEGGVCATVGDVAALKGIVDGLHDLVATSLAPTVEYRQDFELLDQQASGALSADGWLVFANIFDGVTLGYLYGYGPFSAPNGGPGFSGIDIGKGGFDQGSQQLVVYSNYDDAQHGSGNLVEANVFRERTIVAGDVGRTLTFSGDALRGNIAGDTTAIAFIKTLDPNNSYAQSNFITYNTTSLPLTWSPFAVSLDIDAGLVGQILQYGFSTTATNYEGSGNFYDNLKAQTVPTAP